MDSKVAEFISITNASVEEAQFYIESAKGDLDTAVASYFSNVEEGGAPVAQTTQTAPVSDVPRMAPPPVLPRMVTDPSLRQQAQQPSQPNWQGPRTLSGNPPPPSTGAAPRAGGGPAAHPVGGAGGPRIASLGDFAGGPSGGEDEDDMNEYYAGGEKSGVAVQGRRDDRDRVGGLFDRARELGAREATGEDLERLRGRGARGGQRGGPFRGTARKLGDSGPVEGAVEDVEMEEEAPADKCHKITFFANGVFTVDDGPGRRADDPREARFLRSLMEGVVPEELRPQDPSVHVDIHLERNPSDYVEPPKPKYKAFSGTARTIGGPEAEEGTGAGAGPSSTETAAAVAGGSYEYSVDEAQPATSVQFRFWDGRKIVAKFNLDQTVGSVRRFLLTARPDLPPSFTMKSMGFPPKPITDEGQTIKDAGLENSVVVVSK